MSGFLNCKIRFNVDIMMLYISIYRKTSNKRRASNELRSLIDPGGVEWTELNKRRPLINAGGTLQWYSDLDIQVNAL